MPHLRAHRHLTSALLVLAAAGMRAPADVPARGRPAGPVRAAPNAPVTEWVLPNGRIVRPSAQNTRVGGFPLGLAFTPGGKHVVVSNCGAGPQSLTVHDARTLRRTGEAAVKTLFGGVAVSPDGKYVWACGGGANAVLRFRLTGTGDLEPDGQAACPGYPVACVPSPDGKRLYVACNLGSAVRVVDTHSLEVETSIETGALPYAIAVTRDGRRGYVTNWADRTVSVLDFGASRPLRTVPVGGLPCAVVLTPDERRAYVANANDDTLTVIDTARDTVADTVRLQPYPRSPNGAIPNALAVSADGQSLYVAMAGVNAVGVVALPDHALTAMLPTGWYPTVVRVLPGSGALYVLSSKGTGSGPNSDGEHISSMMRGLLERIEPGDKAARARATEAVRRLNGFDNSGLKGPARVPGAPAPGFPRGIKHVVFIVRENRTFDQVLGDLPGVNGDSRLTLYGEEVTPNLHALARRFAVCDNAYAEGEVSLQGHQWTLGAFCPDYVEKVWHAVHSQRGRLMDAVPGPHAYPALGYMMDHCVRHHVSCRMYGDTVRRERGGQPIASMRGVAAADYPGWNLSVPDVERVRAWQREMSQGIFRAFTYLWLPNDHTAGSTVGMPTPRSMVAENDLATGIVLDTLSRHPEWKDTVVFLTEDDTQDGRDHVSAHRNILLVMGPWVRSGAVSSRHYSISSVYATIERLLGLPPMSQFDDLADPIGDVWAAQPDLRPYRVQLNRVPLNERNTPGSPGARESAGLDLEEPDAGTGPLLERILWRAAGKPRRAPAR